MWLIVYVLIDELIGTEACLVLKAILFYTFKQNGISKTVLKKTPAISNQVLDEDSLM